MVDKRTYRTSPPPKPINSIQANPVNDLGQVVYERDPYSDPPDDAKKLVAATVGLSTQTPCLVVETDKGPELHILMNDAVLMARLKSRAFSRDLGDYIWTQIVKAALYGHCF